MYYIQEVFFLAGGGGGVSFAILKVKVLHFFFCMVNLVGKKKKRRDLKYNGCTQHTQRLT